MSAQEWRALLRSLMLLPVVDVSLRWRGYGVTRSWLHGRLRKRQQGGSLNDEEQVAREIASAVDKAARRGFWPASCLRQALVLEHLLQERGIATDLHIGVRKGVTAQVEAHAWLERNGVVLIGGGESAAGHVPLPMHHVLKPDQ